MVNIINQLNFQPALLSDETPSALSSEAICAEAIRAYKAGRINGSPPNSSVWKIHSDEVHSGFLKLLENGNAKQLSNYLSSLHRQTVLRGYDQHAGITQKLDEADAHRNAYGRQTYNALMQLGAALGVIREFNPEQPGNYPYLDSDQSEDILGQCLSALGGIKALPSTGPGAYGLKTSFGSISFRHVFALGYLREIRTFLAQSSRRYDQVVEIGGGLGRTAFHAAKDLGLKYTIIDLPAVGVTQYLMLRGNGVSASLWDNSIPTAGHVRLEHAYAQHDPARYKNALFVSFDAFVEMGAETQDIYFDLMRAAEGDFLSINHEANKTMTHDGQRQNWNLERFADWGYRLGPRQVFWERAGYVSRGFTR